LPAFGLASSIAVLRSQKSAAGIRNAGISKKVRVGTGWQLLEGVAALLLSIAVTYWLFVSPSRAKRERQRLARALQDPRRP
jgi:type II secretory pathway component PulM